MSRTVSACITDATGAPNEGLRVDFHAANPLQSTSAMTDASGVFVVELVPLVVYQVSTENPFAVDGQPFPAGMVFRVTVPEGDGPVTIAEITTEIIDASRPALLGRLLALETRIAALEGVI